MAAMIKNVEYYLPESVISNDDLKNKFPSWPMEKIENKTGIRSRRKSAKNNKEC